MAASISLAFVLWGVLDGERAGGAVDEDSLTGPQMGDRLEREQRVGAFGAAATASAGSSGAGRPSSVKVIASSWSGAR